MYRNDTFVSQPEVQKLDLCKSIWVRARRFNIINELQHPDAESAPFHIYSGLLHNFRDRPDLPFVQ